MLLSEILIRYLVVDNRVGGKMVQDQKTGAKAVAYGLATAKKIAAILGAEKTGNPRSNEYILKRKCVVIKCARQTTNSRVGRVELFCETRRLYAGMFEEGMKTDRKSTRL